MTEAQIRHMADRFLGWRLPEDFNPDGGITFQRTSKGSVQIAGHEHTSYPVKNAPIGTNLFDAVQAVAMVRYMLDGLPESTVEPVKEADIQISVYLDDGIVFDYYVKSATSAREHVSAIIKTGYRHSESETPDEMTHFPPHRILKVKMRGPGITTMYYDRPRGT